MAFVILFLVETIKNETLLYKEKASINSFFAILFRTYYHDK